MSGKYTTNTLSLGGYLLTEREAKLCSLAWTEGRASRDGLRKVLSHTVACVDKKERNYCGVLIPMMRTALAEDDKGGGK
jgi:hypothetical protein